MRRDGEFSMMGISYPEEFRIRFILEVREAVAGGVTVRTAIGQIVSGMFEGMQLQKRALENAVRAATKNLHARYYEWLRNILGDTLIPGQEWYERGTLPRPLEERVRIDPLADLKPALSPRRGRPGKRAKRI